MGDKISKHSPADSYIRWKLNVPVRAKFASTEFQTMFHQVGFIEDLRGLVTRLIVVI